MIFSRRCLLAVVLAVHPTLFAASAKKASSRAVDNATAYRGAIVMDAATGNILFEDRADTISPPASMAKLMTFAIVHDHIASGALTLATPVKITNEDSGMGGTQVFLDPRETFSVEELIYAMMIQSANDASHALARAVTGSVAAFVELMNAKAASLGMKNTTFRTPHGLPPATRKAIDGDLTTPRDFALLSRYLIKNTSVLKYTAVTSRPFGAGSRAQPMEMKNHNKLVGKVGGVDGLKTGFTDAAGYCLSATAERTGRRVILVIMGSLGPNGQRDLGRARDVKAIELLERGFAALPPVPKSAAPVAMQAGQEPVTAPATSASAKVSESPIKPAPRPVPASTPVEPAPEPPIKFSVPKK